jgi:hypothetical protein
MLEIVFDVIGLAIWSFLFSDMIFVDTFLKVYKNRLSNMYSKEEVRNNQLLLKQ